MGAFITLNIMFSICLRVSLSRIYFIYIYMYVYIKEVWFLIDLFILCHISSFGDRLSKKRYWISHKIQSYNTCLSIMVKFHIYSKIKLKHFFFIKLSRLTFIVNFIIFYHINCWSLTISYIIILHTHILIVCFNLFYI